MFRSLVFSRSSIPRFTRLFRRGLSSEPEDAHPMSPEVLQTLQSIRAERLERMKAMYGDSSSASIPEPDLKAVPVITPTTREKLPKHMSAEERAAIPEPWNEPEMGKLTQAQIMEMFDERRRNPEHWTAERIAAHYGLDVEVSRNIVNNCNSFVIVYDKMVDTRPIGLWDVTADQARMLKQRKGLNPDVSLV